METSYGGNRLLVTYSPVGARKDAHEREKALNKLKNKYAKKKCTTVLRGKSAKYLQVIGEGKLDMNDEAIITKHNLPEITFSQDHCVSCYLKFCDTFDSWNLFLE